MRKLAYLLVAVLVGGLATIAPAAASRAAAATNPKVAIIVGATHDATATYRLYANQIYAEAIKFTPNVVRVYSPAATWTAVKAAVNGASIIVYLGHGNGWPSPYTYDPNYTTKDGFGLNYDNNGDGKLSDYENRYYGEPSIRTLTPAPNAVVLLFHLCYASGNSEPQDPAPTLSVATQRVDNYAAAFIKAGARAVIVDGHSHDPYYINALFTTKQTIDQYWRHAPDFHNHVRTYASTRNPGYTYQLDPESSTAYYRSITGNMALTTTQVTGANYASTSGDPSTFVVPGNATPSQDNAPLYDSADAAALGTGAVGTLSMTTTVRIDSQEPATSWDGWPVFRIHTDDGTTGWMTGAVLLPRDSAAPRLWEVDDAGGVFSPNGDGRQDAWTLGLTLSESSAWALSVVDSTGTQLASATGTSRTPALTWAPAAGAVPDGTYTWRLTARDSWGNGPLESSGRVVVDTQAPDLSLPSAVAATVPSFAPNGDGYRETIGFAGSSSEPGSLVATASNEAGTVVDTFSVPVGTTAATLTWDGVGPGGVVPDGRYTISVRARDLAGNLSDAQERTVDVYAALGFVQSSAARFFPQDGDGLAKTTTFSMRLLSPATVTWTVVNAAGTVVRTLRSAEAMAAGAYTAVWDGRTDAGTYVPRGTYRTEVTATDGTWTAVQRASVLADAFAISSSDTTPARGQRITVTVITSEALKANPRVAVFQPGITLWTVSTTRLSSTTYRVTITLRSSRTGTLRIKAYGYDSAGRAQSSNLLLPLH